MAIDDDDESLIACRPGVADGKTCGRLCLAQMSNTFFLYSRPNTMVTGMLEQVIEMTGRLWN